MGSVTEAMDRWLWDGQPYYVARQHLPAADAIRLINQAGGVAVIAHPLEYGYDNEGVERLIQTGHDLGAVGVECRYSGYTAQEEALLESLARAGTWWSPAAATSTAPASPTVWGPAPAPSGSTTRRWNS